MRPALVFKQLDDGDVVFEHTQDPALMDQYYKIRHKMYTELWNCDAYPPHAIESDHISDIIVARRGNNCVGGARLIIKEPLSNRLLPVEQQDNIDLNNLFPDLCLSSTVYAELSGFTRLPEYGGYPFSSRLYDCIKEHCLSRDVRHLFLIAAHNQTRNYRLMFTRHRETFTVFEGIHIPTLALYGDMKDMCLSMVDYQNLYEESGTEPVRASQRA